MESLDISDSMLWDMGLFLSRDIGPASFWKLKNHFGSAKEIFSRATQGERVNVENLGLKHSTLLFLRGQVNLKSAENQWIKATRSGVKIIHYSDKAYPHALKNLNYPPPFLFVMGELPNQMEHTLGVVGTRAPSVYGEGICNTWIPSLVQNGFGIVSGLARGIDTFAHEITLDSKGKTIAVLGSGLDRIYPEENTGLANRIAKTGAVITPFPMGTLPDRGRFPQRNAYIAALSKAILVIEAGRKSGACITAEYGRKQKKTVFAIPGPIGHAKSEGCNRIIQNGGVLCTHPSEIQNSLSTPTLPLDLSPQKSANLLRIKSHEIVPVEIEEESNPEQIIYNSLAKGSADIDQICFRTGFEIHHVASALMRLELEDKISKTPEGKYCRNCFIAFREVSG